MKSGTVRRFFIVLTSLLLAATILFIWSNSLKNAGDSQNQSDRVGAWLREHFDVEKEPMKSVYENRRKVAHFCEFALLGAEVATLLFLIRKCGGLFPLYGLLSCVGVAFCDEGIQLFSAGRAASLFDVALDSFGSFCGGICFWLLFFFVGKLLKKRNSVH